MRTKEGPSEGKGERFKKSLKGKNSQFKSLTLRLLNEIRKLDLSPSNSSDIDGCKIDSKALELKLVAAEVTASLALAEIDRLNRNDARKNSKRESNEADIPVVSSAQLLASEVKDCSIQGNTASNNNVVISAIAHPICVCLSFIRSCLISPFISLFAFLRQITYIVFERKSKIDFIQDEESDDNFPRTSSVSISDIAPDDGCKEAAVADNRLPDLSNELAVVRETKTRLMIDRLRTRKLLARIDRRLSQCEVSNVGYNGSDAKTTNISDDEYLSDMILRIEDRIENLHTVMQSRLASEASKVIAAEFNLDISSNNVAHLQEQNILCSEKLKGLESNERLIETLYSRADHAEREVELMRQVCAQTCAHANTMCLRMEHELVDAREAAATYFQQLQELDSELDSVVDMLHAVEARLKEYEKLSESSEIQYDLEGISESQVLMPFPYYPVEIDDTSVFSATENTDMISNNLSTNNQIDGSYYRNKSFDESLNLGEHAKNALVACIEDMSMFEKEAEEKFAEERHALEIELNVSF